jgi:hypothetical protein
MDVQSILFDIHGTAKIPPNGKHRTESEAGEAGEAKKSVALPQYAHRGMTLFYRTTTPLRKPAATLPAFWLGDEASVQRQGV